MASRGAKKSDRISKRSSLVKVRRAKSTAQRQGVETRILVSEENDEKTVADLVLNHRESGRKIARSMMRRWQVILPSEEVDSLVDLTLCEAARRYRADKGASFITFLFYHLRGHLVRAVASAAGESTMFLALAQSAGLDTTDWATAADRNNWTLIPEQLLNAPTESESPEALLIQKERATLCRDACVNLDDLEKEIITRSYTQDEALVDIAKTLGYSRCHISRVKKRALDRMRGFISEQTQEQILVIDEIEEEKPARRSRRRRIAADKRPTLRLVGQEVA